MPEVQEWLRQVRRSDTSANIILFSKDILTGTTSLFDSITRSPEGEYSDSVSSGAPSNDKVFRFRINPSSVNVKKGKLTAVSLTKAGHIRSCFGNDLTKYSFTASTGYFRPPRDISHLLATAATRAAAFVPGPAFQSGNNRARDEIARRILSGNMNISESPVWRKFREFELYFDKIDTEMVMYFDLRVLTGHLLDLTYDEDANNPLRINYSFTFDALTDTTDGEDRLGRAIKHSGIR